MRVLTRTRHAGQQADIFRDLKIAGGGALGILSWMLISVSILFAAPAAASDEFEIVPRDDWAVSADRHDLDDRALVLKLDGVVTPDRSLNSGHIDAVPYDAAYRQGDLAVRHQQGDAGKGGSEFLRDLRQIRTGTPIRVVIGLGKVKARWRF